MGLVSTVGPPSLPPSVRLFPGLEQYDDNVGAGDDSEDEQARMEEFAELAATQALLGSAVDAWHPPDSLAAAFGNEPKFRVIL
eukprot:m.162807 g.162807  ORF g.162807 m.162807 type:complete len:83 (-) comp17674_c0_seq1:128-376(-)